MTPDVLPAGAVALLGERLVPIPEEIRKRFRPGDRLLAVAATHDLLLIPQEEQEAASAAVSRACRAFDAIAAAADAQVSRFYEEFARRLESDEVWARIAEANAADTAAARARGRSVTRLEATPKMRREMIAGLRMWRDAPTSSGRVVETVRHEGWRVEQVAAPLGVVGFVFEARPNVFADATGVLRGGNTVVFRIGSDALGTARAIVREALEPALAAAGLPPGAASLVESGDRASGWALFSDSRLAIAVARGSGAAVRQLGAIARQAGIPVSLHGTGGAWLVADETADPDRLEAAVYHSLDRKVCNTLNVCCLPRSRTAELLPRFLSGLRRAGERRGRGFRLWVVEGEEGALPEEWRPGRATPPRSEGGAEDGPLTRTLPESELGREWEWDESPEVTLKLAGSLDEAIALFNRYSPRFIACLISRDPEAHRRFYEAVNAPFVGDGFTRWVDGQYALGRPELGLSNWQEGRLFARSAILSGDGVFTLRTRAFQTDPELHR